MASNRNRQSVFSGKIVRLQGSRPLIRSAVRLFLFPFIPMTFLVPLLLSAQIRYTDVVPDSTVIAPESMIWANFDLDLDGDGMTDVFIVHHNTRITMNYAKVEVQSATPEAEILCEESPVRYPLALAWGEHIGPGRTGWHCTGTFSIPLNDNRTAGNWVGVADGYLGVRIHKAGGFLHGWVRLNVPFDADSFTVKDYAVEMTPDRDIVAGDRGTNVTERDDGHAPSLAVYPHPVTSRSIVQSPFPNRPIIWALYDMNGKAVAGGSADAGAVVCIERSFVPAGVYIMVFLSSNLRASTVLVAR
ncbi:MAG: T9SS type A sorting domain-containing protein [Bacteroidota bacterium]|nr:T9SS type A sorting domain-containing protein [Bacteroidota bacterium]